MKIAVISDIHGNMEALNAVMQDIEKQGCERIFVLGDYAMAGPEPKEVVEFFMRKKDDKKYSMIQGNTDLMIADYTDEIYNSLKEKAPVMAEALKDDAKVLNSLDKSFLKNLPIQLKVEVGGVKFLLVHGSPRKNNEDILPDLPLTDVQQMIKDVDENVILCGHTHIPCGFQTVTKQTVVNAGSVGRPFTEKPQACYLTIHAADGVSLFEHHFVEYDNKLAAKKLGKRNFEGAYKLGATLLNPKERHF